MISTLPGLDQRNSQTVPVILGVEPFRKPEQNVSLDQSPYLLTFMEPRVRSFSRKSKAFSGKSRAFLEKAQLFFRLSSFSRLKKK